MPTGIRDDVDRHVWCVRRHWHLQRSVEDILELLTIGEERP